MDGFLSVAKCVYTNCNCNLVSVWLFYCLLLSFFLLFSHWRLNMMMSIKRQHEDHRGQQQQQLIPLDGCLEYRTHTYARIEVNTSLTLALFFPSIVLFCSVHSFRLLPSFSSYCTSSSSCSFLHLYVSAWYP